MIPVLLDDKGFLVVDKPAGLSVIPERPRPGPCVLTCLTEQGLGRLYVVHRLDKEVSGVLLLAREPASHRYLNDLFSGRQVAKTYLALVHGHVPKDQGAIELPIRQFGSGRMGVAPEGKPSLTHYQVLKRMERFTVLVVRPSTGRRHQIRVHLYALGHPIVGDLRYGDKQAQQGFSRLMLHARAIAFQAPDTRPISVEAPIPNPMGDLLYAEGTTMSITPHTSNPS